MGLLCHRLSCSLPVHLLNKTALVFASVVLLTSCGDVFRPVANPIPRPGGDPGVAGEAIVVSGNGSGATAGTGTTTHINTSGDTVVAIEHVGVNPVHAIVVSGLVFVANRDSGTVSDYPASAGPSASVQTITLNSTNPGSPDAQPSFLATTDNANVYVAQPGRNNVGVISLSTLSESAQEIPVPNPIAIAQLPGGGKIYVAQSSNQVTVIDPATLAVTTTVTVGSSPSAIVASPDGNCVYVANQNSGNVSVITTSNDMPTATPITVGAGPVFLRFDALLQRLYVVNKTGGSVSIISHASDCSSTLLATVGVGAAPLSIAALSDKTRAYVANSGDGTVSVIDVSSNTVRKIITVGGTPTSIGASADATKVVVAAGSNVVVIRTTNDTIVQGTNFMPNGAAPSPQLVVMNP